MLKSIKFKLWLTLFITVVSSVGTMFSLTNKMVRERFLDYVTRQNNDLIRPLETSIIASYSKHENTLNRFIKYPVQWDRVKQRILKSHVKHQKIHPAKKNNKNNKNAPNEVEKQKNKPKSAPRKITEFYNKASLYDANKNLIAGPKADPSLDLLWFAVVHEDMTIAHIRYLNPDVFIREKDKHFIRELRNSFIYISISLVFISFAISLIVSRWFTQPLTNLSQNARRVSTGDFSVSTPVLSGDELGQLCHNFNEMTRTLAANESARKKWVADISHEMRTPLAVMKGQIEAMIDNIRPTTQKNIILLGDKVDALSRLINDLYELSLTDLGAMTYCKEKASPRVLVETLVQDNKERLAKMGLQLSSDITIPPSERLYCDTKRLTQALQNLVENSSRYTHQPGKIHICAKSLENTVEIHILDSAPGVPEDKLNAIFDRLFRVEPSRNRETGGAGLGLSICKNIVEAHEGTISAKASRLGGLDVSLTFPKAKV